MYIFHNSISVVSIQVIVHGRARRNYETGVVYIIHLVKLAWNFPRQSNLPSKNLSLICKQHLMLNQFNLLFSNTRAREPRRRGGDHRAVLRLLRADGEAGRRDSKVHLPQAGQYAAAHQNLYSL